MRQKVRFAPAAQAVREQAAAAADALRRTIVDPAAAGVHSVMHVDLCRPRRGVLLSSWSSLPGLIRERPRDVYTHALLPGWEYTRTEVRTEMIDDLEILALTGERPTASSR